MLGEPISRAQLHAECYANNVFVFIYVDFLFSKATMPNFWGSATHCFVFGSKIWTQHKTKKWLQNLEPNKIEKMAPKFGAIQPQG